MKSLPTNYIYMPEREPCNDSNGFEFISQLHLAALNGHAAVTKQLLIAHCNVDLQNMHGFSPLYVATLGNHATIVEQLLAAGCNTDLRDQSGISPLFVAAKRVLIAAVTKLLIEARCNIDLQQNDGTTPLQAAARRGMDKNFLLHATTHACRRLTGARCILTSCLFLLRFLL
jgi:ankyrin repeat protein